MVRLSSALEECSNLVNKSSGVEFVEKAINFAPMVPITKTKTAVQLRNILDRICADDQLHAKWLNTLSYMEHIGATKIARTQSGPMANFMTLKHAAEEARHGFFLKHLSRKLWKDGLPTYENPYLLAPVYSHQYLYRLDLEASRLGRKHNLEGRKLHDLTYLLVTYAIEVRADELYPIYQEYLDKMPEKRLSVQGIINEEEGHLAEMETELANYPEELRNLTEPICALENRLYEEWLIAVERDLAEA